MRARVCELVLLILCLTGCGSGSVSSQNPSQTLTWLASEIDAKYTEDFTFEFPVHNQSSSAGRLSNSIDRMQLL